MTTPIFKFDKRIKDMRDILTGVTFNADYIGQKGYFASHLGDYKNLDRRVYGKLVEFTSTLMFKCEGNYSYQYFLPESKLLPKEEKKYKPFSLKNWIYTYDLGDTVIFRDKGDDTEFTMLYAGYVSDGGKTYFETEGHGIIYLGNKEYTLNYLFEHFELWKDGEWKPFGIEEIEE